MNLIFRALVHNMSNQRSNKIVPQKFNRHFLVDWSCRLGKRQLLTYYCIDSLCI